MEQGESVLSVDPLLLGLLLLILMVVSAFFSGSETALLGFDWLRLRYLVRKGDRRAIILKNLLSKKDMLIGTILVGNNIANVAASAIATALAITFFGDKGIAIATGIMTLFLLIFSEIAPKTLAAIHTEKVGLTVSFIFRILSTLLYPVVVSVTAISNTFLKILGVSTKHNSREPLSEEEIRTILTESTDPDTLAENKRQMLHGIFQIGRHTVKEIMVPRTRVSALEVSTPLTEAADQFIKTGYTRMPVYRDKMDSIVGVVHSRDLLPILSKAREAQLFTVMREPLFVPESMTLETILYEFQARQNHIAIVVDEFGGVEGIVTLEDVLEEIVGEIRDEHDIESEDIRYLPGGEAVAKGNTPIREINMGLKLKIPTDVDVTLGGFVMTSLGHIPEAGESFLHDNARYTMERMSKRRITLVRVSPIPPSPPKAQ